MPKMLNKQPTDEAKNGSEGDGIQISPMFY